MDDSTQDPFGPLNELKKPMNIISAIRELQAAGQPSPSANTETLEEITGNDTGPLVVDEIIAPAPDVEVLDPEDLSFYGAGMTGGGRTFGSEIMNFWAVGAGVFQVGFNNLGKLTFGAGAGSLSVDGIAIAVAAAFSNPTSIRFLNSGLNELLLYCTDNGTTLAQGFLTHATSISNANKDYASTLNVQNFSKTGYDSNLNVQSDSGGGPPVASINILSSAAGQSLIQLNNLQQDVDTVIWGSLEVFRVDAANNIAIFNENSGDIDVRMEGNGDANLFFLDASTDRIGIGTAAPSVKLEVNGDFLASNVLSGTYTPTLTNVTNVASSTAFVCQYMRVGRVVTVSGAVTIDPTAVGAAEVGMTFPVASAITAAEECGGNFGNQVTTGNIGIVAADVPNNRARFLFNATDAASRTHFFSFTYLIV